ncbi:hypothetical protein WN944_003616 [Citrus x changshan-huyou]|uniref:Uncharacterized protein n=1 Tax=Citrus x changshan-huyou TaxID=2935761 RepID=A0AAP0M0B8_9ROSI
MKGGFLMLRTFGKLHAPSYANWGNAAHGSLFLEQTVKVSSFCFSFLVDVHKYGQYLVMLGQTEDAVDAVLLSSY